MRALPGGLYLGFSSIFFALTPRPQVTQAALNNPPLVGLIDVLWLLLGLFVVAWWLEAPPLSLPRQSRVPRRWLYLPLGLGAAYLAYILVGMVVADIYFKAGQEYDRAGQSPQAFAAYSGSARWGIPQDIYFSFLGGYYLNLAQRQDPSLATRPSPNAAKTNKVDDLFAPAVSLPWTLGREDLLALGRVALTEAYRLGPLNPDNGQNMGRFYTLWSSLASEPEVRDERFGKANAFYETAIKLRPTSSSLWAEWGYSLFVAGADDDAEAKYNRSIAIEPDYAAAWAMLGELRLAQQRPRDAAVYFRQTAEALASRSQDSVTAWGKTYKVDELLRQADALDATPT